MPVVPQEMDEQLASHPAVRAYLSARGKRAHAAMVARHGQVGRPFTSETASRAAASQWTPARRAAQAEWMRRNNPRSKVAK